MLNGNGKLNCSRSTTYVCRRDRDVLLRINTLDDELHTRVPLLLKTKLISILPPYMLTIWGNSLKFAFPLLMSSKNTFPHSTIACNVSYFNNYRAARLCFRENFRKPFGLPNILAGAPGPTSWSPEFINQ